MSGYPATLRMNLGSVRSARVRTGIDLDGLKRLHRMARRLVIPLVLLFVIGVSGYAQSKTPEGNANGNSPNQENANASNGSTNDNPPKPVHSADETSHHDDCQTCPLSYKDKIDLVLTFVLVVLVAVQSFIAWRLNSISDQQRQIMEKQIEAIETTERAYIGIAKMQLFISGDEPTIEITWINGGKTPAWHFRCVPSLNIGEKPEPNGPLMDDDFSDIRNSFIPAGAERRVSYTDLGVKLSNEVLAHLGGPGNNLYAVMEGSYRDVRWKARRFESWALYEHHPFNPQFVELESDYEKNQANPS
jgi:hypothetical protein